LWPGRGEGGCGDPAGGIRFWEMGKLRDEWRAVELHKCLNTFRCSESIKKIVLERAPSTKLSCGNQVFIRWMPWIEAEAKLFLSAVAKLKRTRNSTNQADPLSAIT